MRRVYALADQVNVSLIELDQDRFTVTSNAYTYNNKPFDDVTVHVQTEVNAHEAIRAMLKLGFGVRKTSRQFSASLLHPSGVEGRVYVRGEETRFIRDAHARYGTDGK